MSDLDTEHSTITRLNTTIGTLKKELSATQQNLEAAEAIVERMRDAKRKAETDCSDAVNSLSVVLRKLEAAEAKNAELTRKLAEENNLKNLYRCELAQTADKRDELIKLLSEAKSKAESNINDGYPGIAHDFETVKLLCKEMRDCLFNLANRCDPEWGEVQDSEKLFEKYEAMLAAAPQPAANIDQSIKGD